MCRHPFLPLARLVAPGAALFSRLPPTDVKVPTGRWLVLSLYGNALCLKNEDKSRAVLRALARLKATWVDYLHRAEEETAVFSELQQ